MADVIHRMRDDQPMKSGGVVVKGPDLNPIIAINSKNLPDTYDDNEEARLTGRFRHRLYYTTGAADPA